MSQRPLAAVMVADADPLTVKQLRRLSQWCDLVLCEATATLAGAPREPLREHWAHELGLDRPQLRVITSDLTGDQIRQREWTQRNSVVPLLVREAPDRPVIIADSDEFLDADAVLALLHEPLPEPVRLGLVPLFGSVDRVARSIHCCRTKGIEKLRDPDYRPKRPYSLGGPAVATAGALVAQAPAAARSRAKLADGGPYGTHITLCGSAAGVAWKLRNTRHNWDPRVLDEAHLSVMLDSGVHPAGWWVSEYRAPEPWLVDLAVTAGLRVSGVPLPLPHLRALRAWAQERLDPELPDNVVAAGDHYAASRSVDAEDHLVQLDLDQIGQPVPHTGHASDQEAHDCSPATSSSSAS